MATTASSNVFGLVQSPFVSPYATITHVVDQLFPRISPLNHFLALPMIGLGALPNVSSENY